MFDDETPQRPGSTVGSLLSSNDRTDRVLRAALEMLGDRSIDKLTVSDIIAVSQVSRGTVYTHLGDVSGILASLWVAAGAQWLESVIASPSGRRAQGVDLAFVQIICASRRNPEIAEVVVGDVKAMLDRLDRSSRSEMLRCLWLLTGLIGLNLMRPLHVDLHAVEHLLSKIANTDPRSITTMAEAVGIAEVPAPLKIPEFPSSDPIESRLMVADLEVVASSGVAAASMLRVCRAARLTPGAASPRFSSLQELHSRTLEQSVSELIESDELPEEGITADTGAETVSQLFGLFSTSSTWRSWRNYRQELLIGSLDDAQLAEQISSALLRLNGRILEMLENRGFTGAQAANVLAVNNCWSVGFHALREVTGHLDEQNLNEMVGWVLQVLDVADLEV